MSRRRKAVDNGRQAGFTLLEVILSMMYVAIISAVTYSVLIATLDYKDQVEKASLLNKVGQSILKVISKDLEGLYTLDVGNPFEGIDDDTQDYLNFTSTVSSYPNEEGVSSNLIEVGYRLQPNEVHDGLYILLRRESYHIEHNPLKGGKLYEVYDQVKQFNLQYYDGTDWVDTWKHEDMNSIPLAVKVEFVIRARTGEFEEEVREEEERNEDKEEIQQEGYFSAVITIPIATRPQETTTP
jgi:type II secretion system protein J